MSIKAVLFDLDGTLLPMDQDMFVKAYFKGLATKMAPHGYEPEKLGKAIMLGMEAMYKNDGSKTNEKAFWNEFAGIFGDKVYGDTPYFEDFYIHEFQQIKDVACGYDERAAKVVHYLQENNIRVTLATNPLFPALATQSRIRWAGLTPEDFEIYTTYEHCSYCKPNPDYYKEILDRMDIEPEECLMVGNDVGEDMVTQKLGMKVFLLTDCLINKDNVDISVYPHGGFDALMDYISELI